MAHASAPRWRKNREEQASRSVTPEGSAEYVRSILLGKYLGFTNPLVETYFGSTWLESTEYVAEQDESSG